MSSRHPVHTCTGCWIICEKMRKRDGHQANHLGTPQHNLGTPLGVPTPTLGTPALDRRTDRWGSGFCCTHADFFFNSLESYHYYSVRGILFFRSWTNHYALRVKGTSLRFAVYNGANMGWRETQGSHGHEISGKVLKLENKICSTGNVLE